MCFEMFRKDINIDCCFDSIFVVSSLFEVWKESMKFDISWSFENRTSYFCWSFDSPFLFLFFGSFRPSKFPSLQWIIWLSVRLIFCFSYYCAVMIMLLWLYCALVLATTPRITWAIIRGLWCNILDRKLSLTQKQNLSRTHNISKRSNYLFCPPWPRHRV